jgi:uncharacterized protein (DUF305 family)
MKLLHLVVITTLAATTSVFAQPATAPATKAYMDAMAKMQSSMPPPSGDPDVDFAKMMIPHHQGAIDMAKTELQYGKDPILKKMAQKIIKDQEKEVAEFNNWLKKKGK